MALMTPAPVGRDGRHSRDTLARLLGAGPEETIVTQRLFEHFKARRDAAAEPAKHNTPALDSDIQMEWRNIIRQKLYATAAGAVSAAVDGVKSSIGYALQGIATTDYGQVFLTID